MRYALITASAALALSLTTALAQDDSGRMMNDDLAAGSSLLEQGAKIFLRGLMQEMEPALDDMAAALQEAEPLLRDLMTKVDDIANYHLPEVLPNGDILIRKKTEEERLAEPEGEVEL